MMSRKEENIEKEKKKKQKENKLNSKFGFSEKVGNKVRRRRRST